MNNLAHRFFLDEQEKVTVVGLLNGYLSALGDQISSLLFSLPHVTRLLKTLVQVLEFDTTDQKILEESGMGSRNITGSSIHELF